MQKSAGAERVPIFMVASFQIGKSAQNIVRIMIESAADQQHWDGERSIEKRRLREY